MNDLMMNITSDSNQEYETINGGSPIQKRTLEKGGLALQYNCREMEQIDSCHSTTAQNHSANQNQGPSKVNSNSKSIEMERRKRSSSILQASASSANTSRSLLQGININANNNNNVNHHNTSQASISYLFDDLLSLDKEMFAEKLQIQNSVLKTERNHFEIELRRKADTIDLLEKKIEEMQKKFKIDIERKEQLELEQTVLQKKINDIVNIYENNNDQTEVSSLKKTSADLRSELNLKQMVIEKQKETIKQLTEQSDLLAKNELEIIEAQKKTQLTVDKFEIINKDLQRFLKQSTEMQIKLRNQLMISENNRQLLEEKIQIQTQRANILQNNHNMSMNQDVNGSRANLNFNQEILRLTKGSQEQSFAFNHLESINQDFNFKKQLNSHQVSVQQQEDLVALRGQHKSMNDQYQQNNQFQNQEEEHYYQKDRNQNKAQQQQQQNGKTRSTQSLQNQLHYNSLTAAVAGFSKFQNSLQCNALSKEELFNLQGEQEIPGNLSLLSNQEKDSDQVNQQPPESARSQQQKFYAQHSQRKNSNHHLMSSLKEHLLSLSENKENLNEQLHEILKESKRGNDKNAKELMVKFESRLGQFFNELARQAEALVILQQRSEEQDSLIEIYHKQAEDNLVSQKTKYKKQIKALLKDVEILTQQKDELVKKFELQINESYEQAQIEVSKQFENKINDLQSLLDQAYIREQQLEIQIKQHRENSNQKQQRMLQRFKNNSISSNSNQYVLINGVGHEKITSNRNSQVIENINFNHNENWTELGSKTYRDSSVHQQTRDESEYKENLNSQNVISNIHFHNNIDNKSTLTHHTYSPTPSRSINYLSSEQQDNQQSQISSRTNGNNGSQSTSRSTLNNRKEQQGQQQNYISNTQNQSERQQQRRGDEQSIYSSRNYNLSPSSQQNQHEQNSLEFSRASQQTNNSLKNGLRNSYDSKANHQNSLYNENNDYNYQSIKHSQNADIHEQNKNINNSYREEDNSITSIQKKLYDQFNCENNKPVLQVNQSKKNLPSLPHPSQSSQTLKNKLNRSQQQMNLNVSIQSNHSQSNNYHHLQDTFGQKEQGFNQQILVADEYNTIKQGSIQEKQKQNTLGRAHSYSNLNSSRNQSQAASSCVGEYIESIHIMKESKQLNSMQNYDSYNSNRSQNGYNKHFNEQNQQNSSNQFQQQQLQEHQSEEYQKSITDWNTFNNFTFTQSQQNYNGISDIEAYYTQQQPQQQQQHQQMVQQLQQNQNHQIQQQQGTQKLRRQHSNKLQIVTDTYDEQKLDQINLKNENCVMMPPPEVNKSTSSSQRIKSSASNYGNQQSTMNTSSANLNFENQSDQMNFKQTYKK